MACELIDWRERDPITNWDRAPRPEYLKWT